MAAGDPFSRHDRVVLDEAIRSAEQLSRVEFSVFVGRCEGSPRDFATSLHNTLVAPSRSVMIMIDPERRVFEIVTGGYVRRSLDDARAHLVALSMQSAFETGDLVAGIRRGILMIAEGSRAPQTLHAGPEDV